MLSNRPRGVIYIGVTSDLIGRLSQYDQGLTKGFVTKYGCFLLVWYERHDDIEIAIQREKSLKRYKRDWKINLIEDLNPTWVDMRNVFQDMDNPFQPSFRPKF